MNVELSYKQNPFQVNMEVNLLHCVWLKHL